MKYCIKCRYIYNYKVESACLNTVRLPGLISNTSWDQSVQVILKLLCLITEQGPAALAGGRWSPRCISSAIIHLLLKESRGTTMAPDYTMQKCQEIAAPGTWPLSIWIVQLWHLSAQIFVCSSCLPDGLPSLSARISVELKILNRLPASLSLQLGSKPTRRL